MGLEVLRGLRVLAVDDNAINRRVIREMLLAEGMSVEVAESGPEALDRAWMVSHWPRRS
jgi:CheY-like chemotaxis protein